MFVHNLIVGCTGTNGEFNIEKSHGARQPMIPVTTKQIALEYSPPALARTGRSTHAAEEDRTLEVQLPC